MKPVRTWFRLLAYAMAAVFALCAGLQHNDPDPLRWIAIYGAAVFISLLLPTRRWAWIPALAVGVLALAWSLHLVHSSWGLIGPADLTNRMSEKGGAVEAGREAGGLAIEATWLLFAAAVRKRATA